MTVRKLDKTAAAERYALAYLGGKPKGTFVSTKQVQAAILATAAAHNVRVADAGYVLRILERKGLVQRRDKQWWCMRWEDLSKRVSTADLRAELQAMKYQADQAAVAIGKVQRQLDDLDSKLRQPVQQQGLDYGKSGKTESA